MFVNQTFANPVTVNPDRNMKNEKFCSQLSTHFEKTCGIQEQEGLEQEDFQTVLRTAGETETMQELDERHPGFQLLVFL
jgi:hypothetical protein